MIGSVEIQLTLIFAIVMVCFDSRYILVKIETKNEGGSNEIMKTLKAGRGNVGLK